MSVHFASDAAPGFHVGVARDVALRDLAANECFDLVAGVLRSQRFLLGIVDDSATRTACNVLFGSDGSFMIDLCYFSSSTGVAAELPLSGDLTGFEEHLRLHGFATIHHLKFTYHPSGVCNFSKTGKVRSLRKRCHPLSDVRGHVFTLFAGPPSSLRRLAAKYVGRPPSLEHITLSFGANLVGPPTAMGAPVLPHSLGGLLVRGFWHTPETLRRDIAGPADHVPVFFLQDLCGRRCCGMRFAPPKGSPNADKILFLLVCAESSRREGPDLFFAGGFDTAIEREGRPAGTCLALSYPNSDVAELLARAKSLDIQSVPAQAVGYNQ